MHPLVRRDAGYERGRKRHDEGYPNGRAPRPPARAPAGRRGHSVEHGARARRRVRQPDPANGGGHVERHRAAGALTRTSGAGAPLTVGARRARSPGTKSAMTAPTPSTAAPIGSAATTPSLNACGDA